MRITALLAILLAGCVGTPVEVAETPEQKAYALVRSYTIAVDEANELIDSGLLTDEQINTIVDSGLSIGGGVQELSLIAKDLERYRGVADEAGTFNALLQALLEIYGRVQSDVIAFEQEVEDAK